MNLSHILATITAMAPAPEGADQQGHAMVMLIFYLGLFGVFYFLLIRPQSKKNREVREMQESLAKGDRVVTNGGLFATIHKIEEEVVTLEIAEGVRVKAQRSAIFERVREAAAPTEKAGD